MALAIGRTMARSGAYLVKRVQALAQRLAEQGGVRAKNEIVDGFLLRATAAGGRGVGTVIDPPCALIIGEPGVADPYPLQYQVRDWYDSRYQLDDESLPYADLPQPEALRIHRALYDSPSAPLNTPPGGLFQEHVSPWGIAGVEGRRSVQMARILLDTPANEFTFNGPPPCSVPPSIPYGVKAMICYGQQRPLQIDIGEGYLRAEIASNSWRFGAYLPKSVDVRGACPIARIVPLLDSGQSVVITGTTFAYPGALPEPESMLTHPRPGLFMLAHSQQQMLDDWAADPDDQKFEDGLLWHKHWELADLFPIMETTHYICAPRYNQDYALNGGGNPDMAAEAYKVWISGHYSGGTPPINVGKLPSFLNRLCVVTIGEVIHILAGASFFTTADWHDIDPSEVDEPGRDSQLFHCSGLVRLQVAAADGSLLSHSISQLDSSAGPDEMFLDGLPSGRSPDTDLFVEPHSLLAVQGQLAELTVEWVEHRTPGRSFSEWPNIYISSRPRLHFDQSGIRVRHGGKDLFFSIEESGVFPWAKMQRITDVPTRYTITRGLSQVEAPAAVQLSPTEIGLLCFKMEPFGRMAFCVVDLEAETFTVRSEITPTITYTPPHAPESASGTRFQQPPSLSVAQQIVRADDEIVVEGVILLAFAPFRANTLISRDSGVTWQTHITGASSQFGVFFAPNLLRPDYQTGTAAAQQPESA